MCLPNKGTEDVGVNKVAMQAVGTRTNYIDDSTLDLALGQSPGASLKQRVGLTFSCQNLPNLDRYSKTDAFCVLYNISTSMAKECGRTEMVADNLNPEFVTEINVDYMFEQQQRFRIDVYDVDNANQIQNLKLQEYIGSAEFDLG